MIIFEDNIRVQSGYWNVRNVQLAILSSTNVHSTVSFWKNKVKGFSVFGFGLSALFQQNVRGCGPLEVEEKDFIAIIESNHSWERGLTDLAREFFKVVGSDFQKALLFDFVVDPVFETSQMDNTAWAFAIARVDKWIFFRGFVWETDFAASLKLSLQVEDILLGSIDFREVKWLSFFWVVNFQHSKLNSA